MFRSLGREEDLAKEAERRGPVRQEENQKNVVFQSRKKRIFQGRVFSHVKCCCEVRDGVSTRSRLSAQC